jgi:hypothetical protein
MSHWPQVLSLVLSVVNVLSSFFRAGKEGNGMVIIAAVTSAAISQGILYEGGFYACWGFSP